MKRVVFKYFPKNTDFGPFAFIEFNPGSKWFKPVVSTLIRNHGIPESTVRSEKFKTLCYQAYRLGACRIVVHENYMCQDFLHDYVHIYAGTSTPPISRCVRLLFFNDAGTSPREVFAALNWVYPRTDGSKLQAIHGLVGTAVIRPTPDSLVGRTIMMPVVEDGFVPCREYYRCHLFGTPLYALGVPWLEQVPCAYVCGGAALWTCAFHTERKFGRAHYGPGQLTTLARERFVAGHIAEGMTAIEFPTAIREWGCQPFTCTAEPAQGHIDKVVDYVHALIESNISAIICYFWSEDDGETHGHAVTAFGHTLRATPRDGHVSPGEIRSTADWIDNFIVSDDQSSPYTILPVGKDTKGISPEQPLGAKNTLLWTDGIKTDDRAVTRLDDCDRVLVYSPLPENVHITPKEVLPIARGMLLSTEEMLKESADSGRPEAVAIHPDFRRLLDSTDAFALRPTLYELWEFHWKLKTHPTFTLLSQDIREYYLSLSRPLWIWMVQIIELARTKKRPRTVVWSDCKVVGEVLIDATMPPATDMAGAFLVRLRTGIAEVIEVDGKRRYAVGQFGPDDVSYPLLPPD